MRNMLKVDGPEHVKNDELGSDRGVQRGSFWQGRAIAPALGVPTPFVLGGAL